MQVNYASLYSEALNDPLLKRTRVELETAMSNAVEARKVVFELFQDLDGFRLDDYKAMGEPQEGMDALIRFIAEAATAEGETFTGRGDKMFAWIDKDTQNETLLTTERELSCRRKTCSCSVSTIQSSYLLKKVSRIATGRTRTLRPVAGRH